MKSGVSIFRPSVHDLQKYGMLKYVDSSEKPLWLGSPNMMYSAIFAAPALITALIICCVYYRMVLGFGCGNSAVRVGFECGQSVTDARGKIAFDLIIVTACAFVASIVMALRYVSYLVTDRYIHIFIEKNWCVEIAYRTRMAVSKNGSRHFRYELARLRRLEVRSSIVNINVGNIYLCDVNFDSTVGDSDVSCGIKACNQMPDSGHVIKINYKQVVFAGSWKLSLANVIYGVNGIESLCDVLSEIYSANKNKK
jgi:hypothetical protein